MCADPQNLPGKQSSKMKKILKSKELELPDIYCAKPEIGPRRQRTEVYTKWTLLHFGQH